MRRGGRTASLAAAILCAGGCTVGPTYQRPTLSPPSVYRGQITPEQAQMLVDLDWFTQFNEPGLENAVKSAIDQNLDLRFALARVEEFRARARFARVQLFPDVRYAFQTTPATQVQEAVDNAYSAGLAFNWEIDIFGKLRRASEAARADLLSTEDTARAVMSSLVTDVAQTWIDLRRLDRQRAIIIDNVRIQEDALSLVRELLKSGVTSALEEQQALNQLATTRAQLPQTELAILQGENFLSLLLGKPPEPAVRADPSAPQPLPPTVAAGLPAEILERRPDIVAAEHQLHAATARIGVAVANRFPFPTISLTSFLGTASTTLKGIFTGAADDSGTGVFSWGLNAGGPLIDFGRGRASQQVFEAQAEQAALSYRQTILVAFREVADALAAREKTRETIVQHELRAASAGENVKLSTLRFRAGVSSYLEVLDAQRQLLAAQLDLESSRRDELNATIELYRALGGGWSNAELARLAALPASARQ